MKLFTKLIGVAFAALPIFMHAATITPLGLPGILGNGLSISGDGSTVVGYVFESLDRNIDNPSSGFTHRNGQITRVRAPDGFSISLRGVSTNGSVAVGAIRRLNPDISRPDTSRPEAIVYKNGSYESVPGVYALSDVSANGGIYVGSGSCNGVTDEVCAVSVDSNGTINNLGTLNETNTPSSNSSAYAISADGSKIVGFSDRNVQEPTVSGNRGKEAFVFQNGVMTGLDVLPLEPIRLPGHDRTITIPPYGGAVDISADGSTIIGGDSGSRPRSFVYRNGVISELPTASEADLISDYFNRFDDYVSGVSADGSVIAGWSGEASSSEGLGGAAIWERQENGEYQVSLLLDYLLLLGLDVGAFGWDIATLRLEDISDDGNKLVGIGTYFNGEYDGFIIDLAASEVPVPAALWLFASALLGLVSLRRRR